VGAIEQQREGGNPRPVAEGVLAAIGSTPLVRLQRYLLDADVELYLKLEQANPGGSVKDRPAAAMLEAALADGELETGGTVIESSSGNMGVGLAQACRYLGLRLICVVDSRSSAEKVETMRAYGAEVRVVREPDPISGDLLSARIGLVARLCAEIPGAFWPDQYENDSNPRSHAFGTMREIHESLGGEPDYLFVPASTTGTLVGCEQYLRGRDAATEVVAVDAEGSALFGGAPSPRRLPGLGAGIETGISRRVESRRLLRVSELDCVVGCRRLIAREAIFGGASTGGTLAAVSRSAPELPAGSRVAVIAPDGGVGYLRTVYDDAWVQRELGLNPAGIERLVEADRLVEASSAAA
jgi:N-(2-amino-2-carboxyethyl)-L-glutamate synthase